MKVILNRGGNYSRHGNDLRFEASTSPQEVPDSFGKAMVARGYAEKASNERPVKRSSDTAENASSSAKAV